MCVCRVENRLSGYYNWIITVPTVIHLYRIREITRVNGEHPGLLPKPRGDLYEFNDKKSWNMLINGVQFHPLMLGALISQACAKLRKVKVKRNDKND